MLIGGVVVVAVGVAFALYPAPQPAPEPPVAAEQPVASEQQTETAPPEEESPAPQDTAEASPPVPTRPPTPKPPPGALLPALPLVTNLVPRPPEVIRGAYSFVARNPEVSEYIPCFCGCETAGHTANADCFVAARNTDGTVRDWDRHGMACIICVDVAQQSRQLRASGASVRDIRSVVDDHYASSPSKTPTPTPPAQ